MLSLCVLEVYFDIGNNLGSSPWLVCWIKLFFLPCLRRLFLSKIICEGDLLSIGVFFIPGSQKETQTFGSTN